MRGNPGISGKTVLFVNSGGKKKQFTIERAKRLGAKIVLLNSKNDCRKNLVDHFIEADTYDHDECCQKLHAFLSDNPSAGIDGAITFWEDDVPLLGRICDEFGFRGNSYETSILTRNKYEMRRRLMETGVGSPRFALLHSPESMQSAIKEVGFPAVMKPAWGSDSEFVILVRGPEEAEMTFRYLQANCNEQFNPIFKYNNGHFLFEEYMEGMEVSVECWSQYGIPHVIGINEKQPIKLPYFVEYGDIAPARIDDEIAQEVGKLAESALIALGVRDSLAHIEVKITPEGPKIVEVGSRMGGDDIYFNVKNVWGLDMVEIGLQIALGSQVRPRRSAPRDCVICKYFIPKHSGIVSNIGKDKALCKSDDVIHFTISKDIGDPVLVPPEGFENAGWVVVRGKTYQEAETLLEKIFSGTDINVTKFRRDSSLGRTIRENALDTASAVRGEIIQASRLAKMRPSSTETLRGLHIGIITNSSSGEAVRSALADMGYRADVVNVGGLPLPIRKIQNSNFDFVLNLCGVSANSQNLGPHVSSLLEILQIPFSGSGPSAISTALDKIMVKKLLDYHEIPTPSWDYAEKADDKIDSGLKYPLIVKPAEMDDYLGIRAHSVVSNETELKTQLKKLLDEFKQPILVEEYIEGDELSVCVIGNGEGVKVLPLIRSVFKKMPKGYWHIYSSDLMTEEFRDVRGAIRVEKPAKVSLKLNELVSGIALDMYSIFDCADYAVIEMRVDPSGNPFVLELNLNPCISPGDFLPEAAQLAGYSYGALLESIILNAAKGYKGRTPITIER